jgi:hypothetical protein
MAVYIQMQHLRNGIDCLMFTLQGSMEMTVKEITAGKFGNGNSDNLKALITRKSLPIFLGLPQIDMLPFNNNIPFLC